MRKNEALAQIAIAYNEAKYWRGSVRQYSSDAQLIAAVEAGQKSPAFKALLKRVRSGAFTAQRATDALEAKAAWLNAR